MPRSSSSLIATKSSSIAFTAFAIDLELAEDLALADAEELVEDGRHERDDSLED